jgi:hypothetical protein
MRLLRSVAARLWTQAQDYVPRVFEGELASVPAPLGSFIRAQRAPDAANFQLPEPLLGPVPETQTKAICLNCLCGSSASPRRSAPSA